MVQEQVNCLVNEPGAGVNYIPLFDNWHPVIREKVRDSKFNLCSMCLEKLFFESGAHDWNSRKLKIFECLEIIEIVEKKILLGLE